MVVRRAGVYLSKSISKGVGPNPVGNPITRRLRPDLVEVVDEVVEILFVGFRSQTLSTDPLDVVLLVDAIVLLHLLRQHLVAIMTQQFYRFLSIERKNFFFKKCANLGLFLSYFRYFQTRILQKKLFKLQRDSNSDHRSRRRVL